MTVTSKAPRIKSAALGVRAHSGWAVTILLGGPASAPEILERRRIVLCDSSIKGSKQPFHEAEPMPFTKAKAYIERCAISTYWLADAALVELRASAKAKELAIGGCGVIAASGRALPDLKSILASHSLIHAAEGEFYRDAVAAACERAKIEVMRVKERELVEWTASRLKLTDGEVKRRIDEMGKALGPPWTADEKLSATIAWLVLASGSR